MFFDHGFGVAVKSPGRRRRAPAPHLCLGIFLLLLLYICTPNIRVMLESKCIGIDKFQQSILSSASVVQELSSCQYLATQKCSKKSL